MGVPLLYAVAWEQWGFMGYDYTFENPGYYIEAGSLGFSVILFTFLAIICIIFILARRQVVGGELGGEKFGRTWSCVFLCTLWLFYIVLSSIQAYEGTGPTGLIGERKLFDLTKVHRLPKCWGD